jgi:hypothetical protein
MAPALLKTEWLGKDEVRQMRDQKTRIPPWMRVLLTTVVAALICQSVQAGWQKDMVLGTGGGNNNSAPVYNNPGPSAAQIAAQQAAQIAAQEAARQAAQRVAEQQARAKATRNSNNAGLASFKRKDWASAVAYFKQALENSPGNSTLRSNLAQAQEQLNEEHREEERKVADTAAATDMKAAISRATNAPSGSADNSPQQPIGPGLAFISSDDPDHAVVPGPFGTKNSNPKLQAGDQAAGAVGPDTRALDQATSAAHTEKTLLAGPAAVSPEDAATKLGLGFDTGQKKSGSVNEIKVETPKGEDVMPEITPNMAKDPIVQQDLQNYNKWNPQLQKAKEEVKQAQAALDNAKDPGAKAVANTALIAANGKSDGLEIAVQSAKAEIADRKIHLEKFAVSGQASAVQNQALETGAGVSSAPAPAH